MSILIDVQDAAARLDELVEAAKRGDKIVLTEGGIPRVYLDPVRAPGLAAEQPACR